jgi:5'-nucleotidase
MRAPQRLSCLKANPNVKRKFSQVKTPHILISNDDGIHAEGLRALVAALRPVYTVSVVAPSSERSASAQALTLRQPIFCEKIAEREWSVDGTPADAMIVALNKLLPEKPDLVISGINRGGNMGENIFYSGTVGAAAEAAINRIPAIAISVVHRGKDFRFDHAADFARDLAEVVLRDGMTDGVFLNVNVPNEWNGGGVRFTRQSEKVTRNMLQECTDPRGRTYFWLHEQQITDGIGEDTDYAAVFAKEISITPLHLERTHGASMNHLSHWAKELGHKKK